MINPAYSTGGVCLRVGKMIENAWNGRAFSILTAKAGGLGRISGAAPVHLTMSRNLPIVLQILRSTLSKGLTPNREVDIGYDRKRLCLPCLERRRAEDPAGSDRRNAFRLPSSGSFFVSRRFSLPRQFTRAACLMHRASLVNLDSFNVPPPGRHLAVIRRACTNPGSRRHEPARTTP